MRKTSCSIEIRCCNRTSPPSSGHIEKNSAEDAENWSSEKIAGVIKNTQVSLPCGRLGRFPTTRLSIQQVQSCRPSSDTFPILTTTPPFTQTSKPAQHPLLSFFVNTHLPQRMIAPVTGRVLSLSLDVSLCRLNGRFMFPSCYMRSWSS